MLTRDRLVELYRRLQDEEVLSLYIDADDNDPAQRRKWRKQLEGMVASCRESLDDDGARERFEQAWERLQGELNGYDAFLPGKGWIGFATSDEVHYAEEVPVPMPDLVRFEKGIRVAPFVRGLKQERPVVTVLVDSRHARVFEYRDGEMAEFEDLRADTFMGDLSDVGVRKRGHTSSGVRGETSTDQAQRILEVESERMLKELIEVLGERTGDHGFLVIGGTPEMVKRAAGAVPKAMADRVAEKPSMHVGMSLAEVKEAVEGAASELSQARQGQLLAEVVDTARAGGRACLGRDETERALREMRVDTLLLSRSFIRENPDYADHCVGTAFAQDADVVELAEDPAARLDDAGEGIGARLRFTIRNDQEEDAA